MRLVLTCCLSLFVAVSGMAQSDSISFFVSARMHMGFVIKHSAELSNLSKRAPISAQVDFSLLKNSKRAWDYCNCYSRTGVSLNYVDFGNKAQMGEALAAVFYIEPYLSLNRKNHVSFRAGVGPAYLNKVFDRESNPLNLYYSMHLSYLITLNASMYLTVSPRARVVLTAQFNHISNGGTRIPNLGINFPTSGVGFEYNISPVSLPERPRRDDFDVSLKYVGHLFAGPRIAEGYPGWPEVREVFMGINFGVLKPLGKIGHLGIGAEWYHDGLANELVRRKTQLALQNQWSKSTDFRENIAAVSLQYYVFFGKMIFSPQVAFYVTPHNPDIDTNVYQRYFVAYRVTKHWFAGVSLKSHLEVADHAAFTTGVIF